MTTRDGGAQLERELIYYRRECNDLGARLLRLQEEQSQAFREARRSRTTARLVREAYRLADTLTTPEAIGGALLEVVIENAMCDRAALLAEAPVGSGQFSVTHMVGLNGEAPPGTVSVVNPPAFFFTTAQTRLEPPAYALTGILRMPYILWAYDSISGHALILGNRLESNVNRSFETGDQELIEGALSVYLDVLARKQAEQHLVRAKRTAEEAVDATAEFLGLIGGAFRTPLNAIIGNSEKMSSGSRYPLTIERCADFADRIHESGISLVAMLNGLLEYSSFAKGTRALAPTWRRLDDLVGAAVDASMAALGAGLPGESGSGVRIHPRLSGPTIELHVDAAMFCQALQNLIEAAARGVPGNGTVEVLAALRQDGGLELGLHHPVAEAAGTLPSLGPAGPGPSGAAPSGTMPPGLAVPDFTLPMVRATLELHEGMLTTRSERGRRSVVLTLPPQRVRLLPGSGTAAGE